MTYSRFFVCFFVSVIENHAIEIKDCSFQWNQCQVCCYQYMSGKNQPIATDLVKWQQACSKRWQQRFINAKAEPTGFHILNLWPKNIMSSCVKMPLCACKVVYVLFCVEKKWPLRSTIIVHKESGALTITPQPWTHTSHTVSFSIKEIFHGSSEAFASSQVTRVRQSVASESSDV